MNSLGAGGGQEPWLANAANSIVRPFSSCSRSRLIRVLTPDLVATQVFGLMVLTCLLGCAFPPAALLSSPRLNRLSLRSLDHERHDLPLGPVPRRHGLRAVRRRPRLQPQHGRDLARLPRLGHLRLERRSLLERRRSDRLGLCVLLFLLLLLLDACRAAADGACLVTSRRPRPVAARHLPRDLAGLAQ